MDCPCSATSYFHLVGNIGVDSKQYAGISIVTFSLFIKPDLEYQVKYPLSNTSIVLQ